MICLWHRRMIRRRQAGTHGYVHNSGWLGAASTLHLSTTAAGRVQRRVQGPLTKRQQFTFLAAEVGASAGPATTLVRVLLLREQACNTC